MTREIYALKVRYDKPVLSTRERLISLWRASLTLIMTTFWTILLIVSIVQAGVMLSLMLFIASFPLAGPLIYILILGWTWGIKELINFIKGRRIYDINW